MNKPNVDILLATYNGESFLPEQLASIENQTYSNWNLVIRDDGSNDKTVSIIEAFKNKHPNKTQIIPTEKNLGPNGNFIRLMEHSNAEFISFADQDDIWHANKLAASMRELERLTEKHGKEMPLLTHHDSTLMDENGHIFERSFDKGKNVGKANSSLNHILLQFTMQGCSMSFNKALLDKALPTPEKILGHDHYVGLVAETFGKVSYINRPLLKYRIHGGNAVGINPFYKIKLNDFFNANAFGKVRNIIKEAHTRLSIKAEAAENFANHFSGEMTHKQEELFDNFAKLAKVNSLSRKVIIVKNKFYPTCKKLSAALLAFG